MPKTPFCDGAFQERVETQASASIQLLTPSLLVAKGPCSTLRNGTTATPLPEYTRGRRRAVDLRGPSSCSNRIAPITLVGPEKAGDLK